MAGFEERSESFLRWFCAQPGATFHPSIKLVDLRHRHAGRGIVAEKDIPANTTLFTIPRSSVITVETSDLLKRLPDLFSSDFEQPASNEASSEEDGSGSEQEDWEEDVPESWLQLILVLMYEYLKGDSSLWQPYLEALPLSFDTPMFWKESEIEELQGSELKKRIGRHTAEKMFRRSIIPKISTHKDVFYPANGNPLSNDELVDLAHRMGSTIMAYAFELDEGDDEEEAGHGEMVDRSSSDESVPELVAANGSVVTSQAIDPNQLDGSETKTQNGMSDTSDEEPSFEESWLDLAEIGGRMGMVPMADMLNADAEFNAHLTHEESCLNMTTIRPIKSGEEILNYYGALSNAELLRRYGYTSEKHSRYDVVELSQDEILHALQSRYGPNAVSADEVEEELLELDDPLVLERDSGDPDDQGRFCTEPESSHMLDSLTQLVESLDCIANGFDVEKRYFGKLPNVQQSKIKADTPEILTAVLETRGAKYKTSIAEDRELLKSAIKSRNYRFECAIRVRLGEKRLLQEAIAAIGNSAARLEGLDSRRSSKRRKIGESDDGFHAKIFGDPVWSGKRLCRQEDKAMA